MKRIPLVYTMLILVMAVVMVAVSGDGPAIAGTATPKVAGKWEGTWMHRAGSGQISLQLAQEGRKIDGKVNVGGAMPVFSGEQAPLKIGQEVRDATLEGSTLIFHVDAPDAPSGQINFTLNMSGQQMVGTACGYTCATVKLKKAKL